MEWKLLNLENYSGGRIPNKGDEKSRGRSRGRLRQSLSRKPFSVEILNLKSVQEPNEGFQQTMSENPSPSLRGETKEERLPPQSFSGKPLSIAQGGNEGEEGLPQTLSEKSLSGSKGRGITRNVVVVIRLGFLWILTKEWLPTCLGGPLAVTRDSDPKERSGSKKARRLP